MHEGNRLEHLLSKSSKSLIDIAKQADVARQTLYNYFKLEDIPRKKLLTILDIAGIDKEDFFGSEEINDPAAEYKSMKERVKTLEEMVRAKEVIIIQQSEMIELLKQQHKNKKK